MGGKPTYYFDDKDYIEYPDIYYVDLSDQSHLTSLTNSFCRNFTNLRYINLSHLSNITTIGDDFIFNCKKLTSIELSGLTQLTIIGNFFFTCLHKFNKYRFIRINTTHHYFL